MIEPIQPGGPLMHDVAQEGLRRIMSRVDSKPQFLKPRELATRQGSVRKAKSRPVFSASSTAPPQMQRDTLTYNLPPASNLQAFCYEQERWWERCEILKMAGLDDVLRTYLSLK